jgi:hypothetical protein
MSEIGARSSCDSPDLGQLCEAASANMSRRLRQLERARPVIRAGAARRNLPASIGYARRHCGKAPATIELIVDGFYAVVLQQAGWPRQLPAPEAEPWRPLDEDSGARGHRLLARWRDWLKAGR